MAGRLPRFDASQRSQPRGASIPRLAASWRLAPGRPTTIIGLLKLLAGGAGYSQSHAAGVDDPPFQRADLARRQIRHSIYFPDLLGDDPRMSRTRRARMASLLPAFRALRLNLGVSPISRAARADRCINLAKRVEADELPAAFRALRSGRRSWGRLGDVGGLCELLARPLGAWRPWRHFQNSRALQSAGCPTASGSPVFATWQRSK